MGDVIDFDKTSPQREQDDDSQLEPPRASWHEKAMLLLFITGWCVFLVCVGIAHFMDYLHEEHEARAQDLGSAVRFLAAASVQWSSYHGWRYDGINLKKLRILNPNPDRRTRGILNGHYEVLGNSDIFTITVNNVDADLCRRVADILSAETEHSGCRDGRLMATYKTLR